ADDSEAEVIAGKRRHIRAAHGCPHTVEARFPTAATINAPVAHRGPAWVCLRCWAIWLVVIKTPFPDVAGHVFHAEGAGTPREHADRRGDWITIVNIAVAPGKIGIAIGEVCQIATAFVIAPRIFSSVSAARGIFPFCFGRQTIFLARPRAQPLAELNRLEAADMDDGMAVARTRYSFAQMRWLELLVSGIRDQMARQIKMIEGHS